MALESSKTLLEFGLDTAVDTLTTLDETTQVTLTTYAEENDVAEVVFDVVSSTWQSKKIIFALHPEHITYHVQVSGKGEAITNVNYFYGRNSQANYTEFNNIYAPRFDWFEGAVLVAPDTDDSLGCQQWLSPPPFAYAFLSEKEAIYCGVAAKIGTYNFLSFDFTGSRGASFRLTYEGHTAVSGTFISPKLVIGFGHQEKNEAIDSYIHYLRENDYLPAEQAKEIPAWWHEPIFCGWGQMRYDYRADHDGHENDNFINVTFYCTEPTLPQLHRLDGGQRHKSRHDHHRHGLGTKIQHCTRLAPNGGQICGGFIDEQHSKGRKVLLWYTPVVTQGLPDDACMTLFDKPVCPDPTSPVYQQILAEEIRKMISSEPDCLNADGFKIDFTQNTPSENGRFLSYINNFWGLINEDNEKYLYPPLAERQELIQTHGNKWGVEILRDYIRLLHENMKIYKPDSMLITHTPNPYFTEIVDVLRLNDLDGDCQDVLGVMQNRAAIARMCAQNWLLDTDNDLMVDKARWRAYIQLQPQLGIPDTYYASAIANSQEQFDESDYALLRQVWARYRESLQKDKRLAISTD